MNKDKWRWLTWLRHLFWFGWGLAVGVVATIALQQELGELGYRLSGGVLAIGAIGIALAPLFEVGVAAMREPDEPHLVVCIYTNRSERDLTVGTLYRVDPSEQELSPDQIRVIDDTGDSRIYHRNRFLLVEVAPLVMEGQTA